MAALFLSFIDPKISNKHKQNELLRKRLNDGTGMKSTNLGETSFHFEELIDLSLLDKLPPILTLMDKKVFNPIRQTRLRGKPWLTVVWAKNESEFHISRLCKGLLWTARGLRCNSRFFKRGFVMFC